MIPTSKAKEIRQMLIDFSNYPAMRGAERWVDEWLEANPEAAALLSGEDWKEDGSLDEIRKNCVHKWAAVEPQWGEPEQSVCLKCGKFHLDKN